ncbi:hypothetical protein EYF80_008025 [Liparis tanakae]|uniref:Uncharacterized protein n=1 Tax=Liparis tanakae TaxID=230148 RepID=A0A4Z2IUB0_9TELE|nr:hypothetical protein EYF80_008025 [Liparis tanakae]
MRESPHSTSKIQLHSTSYIQLYSTSKIQLHSTSYIQLYSTSKIQLHSTSYIQLHSTSKIQLYSTSVHPVLFPERRGSFPTLLLCSKQLKRKSIIYSGRQLRLTGKLPVRAEAAEATGPNTAEAERWLGARLLPTEGARLAGFPQQQMKQMWLVEMPKLHQISYTWSPHSEAKYKHWLCNTCLDRRHTVTPSMQ